MLYALSAALLLALIATLVLLRRRRAKARQPRCYSYSIPVIPKDNPYGYFTREGFTEIFCRRCDDD